MPDESTPTVPTTETAAAPAPPAPAPPEPEARVAPEAPPPETEPEGEPGGDDPQAVRARKEYRRAKRAEAEVARLAAEKLELDTRLKTIEAERARQAVHAAQPPSPAPAPPRFTAGQCYQAVQQGSATREQAEQYLGRPLEVAVAEEAVDIRLRQVAQHQQASTLRHQATTEVNEYVSTIPALTQQSSQEFRDVVATYSELVGMGYPNDITTERLALRSTFGNIAKLKAAHGVLAEQRRAAPAVTTGNGTGSRPETERATAALTPEQAAFYKAKGWDAAELAKYRTVRSAADLPPRVPTKRS